MTISELIKDLQSMLLVEGDIDVRIDTGAGDKAPAEVVIYQDANIRYPVAIIQP